MLILSSSDFRPRYIKDIATAVAIPQGGRFQFRYQARYLSPDVQRILGTADAVGTPVTICFAGNRSSQAAGSEFIFPVRMGTLGRVEQIGDAYVLTIIAKQYPNLEEWPREKAELVTKGTALLTQLLSNNHHEYYAGYITSNEIASIENGNIDNAWSGVIERLLKLPTFLESYFLRVEITQENGKSIPLISDDTGWINFDCRRSYIIRTWFYGNKEYFGDRTIRLDTDGEVLSSISDQVHHIQSRYDQIDFWFTPRTPDISKRTILRLVSSPADNTAVDDIPTEVEIKCVVVRPLAPRLRLALLAGVSATAVATPGLLGDGTPLSLSLMFAGLGAIGVAIVAGLK